MTSTTTKRYIVVDSYAGHSNWGGSNKDYAICLARVVEGAEADLDAPGSDLEPVWTVLYANGKPGALRGGDPTPPATRTAAEKIYKKKRDEKAGPHHYTPLPGLPFAPYARYFPVPLALPDQDAGSASPEEVLPPPTEQTPRYEASEAVLITREAFEQCIASPRYGATEKVDGERCLVASESERLSAYNRNGIQIRVVPDAASALGQLRASFVVDGERMVGDQAGQYVIFDLLEWQGSDARSWPAGRRIATLQQAMLEAGLLKAPRATPTLHEAFENSTISGLALLTPVSGLEEITCLMSVVQEQGGEGFVLRLLHEGGYLGPRTLLKYKLLADIDVVVIGIKQGAGGGSLETALRRPSDNAAIASGRVRAGLSKDDMLALAEQLAQGIRPVMKIRYLPKRTVGITLVEGRTNREWVRTDKSAWDCTTEQWGEEKAHLVALAPALAGISFEAPVRSIDSAELPSSQQSLW